MNNWLRKLGSRISRFMYGRNGQDDLVVAAYAVGMVVYIIGLILKNSYVMYAALAVLLYGVFRCYSKNLDKRRRENQAFRKLIRKPKNRFSMLKMRMKDGKTHKYYICPECGQIIRVPKTGKKIRITCPKCRHQFTKRT